MMTPPSSFLVIVVIDCAAAMLGIFFLCFYRRISLDKKNLAEQPRAKKEFKSSWVILQMAVKQEMIRMHRVAQDGLRGGAPH